VAIVAPVSDDAKPSETSAPFETTKDDRVTAIPDASAYLPPEPPPAAPPMLFGLPLASFVRGGTPTMAHERAVAEQEADAEKRRDIAAEERRIARVPIDQGGGKMYQQRFTATPGVPQAYVLLDYLTSRGEPMLYLGQPLQCLADLTISGEQIGSDGFGAHSQEMTLHIVCPACIARGMPQGQAQLTIRQSNKHWQLDTNGAGMPIIFENQAYSSAGRVVECERFRCPCGWAARIYNNKVRAE